MAIDYLAGAKEFGGTAAPVAQPKVNFADLEKQYSLPSGILDATYAVESSRGANVDSSAGAQGPFQLMPATAKQYGVKNAYDLNESATAAAKIYSDLSKTFGGDAQKMIAAYNWGQGNVQRQGIEKAPAETRAHLQKMNSAMGNSSVTAPTDYLVGAKEFGGAPAPKVNPVAPKQDRGWLQTFGEATLNFPGDVVKMGGEVVNALMNPLETISAFGTLGKSVATKGALMLPGVKVRQGKEAEVQQLVGVANAVGGDYAKHYGSVDALKETIATEPARFLSDLSMLTGGIGSAAKAGGLATTAKITGGISEFVDPMRAITYPTSKILQGAGSLGKHVRNVVDPRTNEIIQAVGTQGPEIYNALQAQKYEGYAPAQLATAGELGATTGNVGYAGLQTRVQGVTPEITQKYADVAAQRAKARMQSIEGVAKTPEEISGLKKVRGEEYAAGVKATKAQGAVNEPNKTIALIDEMVAEHPSEHALVDELNRVQRNLFDESGAPHTDPVYLTSALEDLKSRIGAEGVEHIQGKLNDIRKQLTEDISGRIDVEKGFAKASKPINQGEVGLYLKGELGPTPKGTLRTERYSAKLENEDEVIKKATNKSAVENTLGELFKDNPDDLKAIYDLRDDVSQEAKFKKAAAEGSQGKRTFSPEKAATVPLLNRVATLSNALFSRLQGKIDKAAAIHIATEMLDPQMAAIALKQAMVKQANRVGRSEAYTATGKRIGNVIESPSTMGTARINALQTKDSTNNLQ